MDNKKEEFNNTYSEEEYESPDDKVQPSMIEAQILNYILDRRSFDFIQRNKLDETYFPGYEEEFLFIKNHYYKYNIVPDLSTFLSKFPDFDLFEVNESEQAMLEAIKEEKAYSLIRPLLVKIDEKARENSLEAAKLLREEAEKILRQVQIKSSVEPYDLFRNAEDRLKDYLKRLEMKGLLGYTSGIPSLDEITHGWYGEDFIALTARIGQGKSWISEYMALMAWSFSKAKVLYLSLENSKLLAGYRADTILKHFSNDSLLSGKYILKSDNYGRPELTKDDYVKWIEEAKNFDVPFIILDETDNGGSQFTIEDVAELIEIHQPNLVFIDQLSLLGPSRRFNSIREHYIHITRTIRKMVNKYKIPIFLACQSGREAAKMFSKDKESTPELHHIAESDSVGQDATRVISLRAGDGLLKISLKKNTFGRDNLEVNLRWDIDHGYILPIELDVDSNVDPKNIF